MLHIDPIVNSQKAQCFATPHVVDGDLRQYVDACKIVKGLEPKFGYFVTKAAEAPQVVAEVAAVTEEMKPEKAKKDHRKVRKKLG